MVAIDVNPISGRTPNIYLAFQSIDEGIQRLAIYVAPSLEDAIKQSLEQKDMGFLYHPDDFVPGEANIPDEDDQVEAVKKHLGGPANLIDGDSQPRVEVFEIRLLTQMEQMVPWTQTGAGEYEQETDGNE